MKDNLKLAVIGLNGIGSYFVRALAETIKKDVAGFGKINPLAIDLYDDDIIEERNLSYTIYDVEHLDRTKAEVLAELTGYRAKVKKIESAEQLNDYDFIVLCVDNNKVRNLVYESDKPFLDLRANGKAVMVYLTKRELDTDKDYLNLTEDDDIKGGCQREEDLEDRSIEFGNRISAEIGLQFLASYLRGEIKNKKYIFMV